MNRKTTAIVFGFGMLMCACSLFTSGDRPGAAVLPKASGKQGGEVQNEPGEKWPADDDANRAIPVAPETALALDYGLLHFPMQTGEGGNLRIFYVDPLNWETRQATCNCYEGLADTAIYYDLSTNSERIAYNNESELWIENRTDNSMPERIGVTHACAGMTGELVWSPYDDELAFACSVGDNTNIYIAEWGSSGVFLYAMDQTSDADQFAPVYADTGNAMAYFARDLQTGQETLNVAVLHGNTTNISEQISPDGLLIDTTVYPKFSPAGQEVFYVAYTENMDYRIVASMANGLGFREVAEGRDFSFSADGQHMVYRGNDGSIKIMNLDGSGERKIASDGYCPSFSPNDQRIAFLREGSDGINRTLLFMNIDGSAVTELFPVPEAPCHLYQWQEDWAADSYNPD